MVTRIVLVLVVVVAASAQSNKELEKIYADDQADRANMFTMPAGQIGKMLKNDGPRRKRVREMIDAGALTTAEDYVRAAFIFQHGGAPDDFLMAHVLGMIATKMDGSGVGIAAMSLDRYLLNTGKPQIFGLDLNATRPFNENLLTDGMRAAVCVPSVASRAKFLAAIAKDPENAVGDNPCLDELSKALPGKWLLTRKDASGQFTQLTLECKLDAEGNLGFHLSGPGIPPRARIATESGGSNLKMKVNGEVFDLAVRGDIITGRYYSGSGSGTIVGMR